MIIESCISALSTDKLLREEGIFRVAGGNAEIAELKEKFESGADPLADGAGSYDVHAIAGCLKLYLRELADPVMTHANYELWVALDRVPRQKDKLLGSRDILYNRMPKEHVAVLRELLPFLGRVAEHGEVNKMAVDNLAIVFGPTLLQAAKETVDVIFRDQAAVNRITRWLLDNEAGVLSAEAPVDDAPAVTPPSTVVELPAQPATGASTGSAAVLESISKPAEPRAAAHKQLANIPGAVSAARPVNGATQVAGTKSGPQTTPATSQVTAAASPASTGCWGRAKFDYEARSARELTFKAGDEIRVFRRIDSNWWEGMIDGKRGYVASAYVTLLTGNDVDGMKGGVPRGSKDDAGGGARDPDYLSVQATASSGSTNEDEDPYITVGEARDAVSDSESTGTPTTARKLGSASLPKPMPKPIPRARAETVAVKPSALPEKPAIPNRSRSFGDGPKPKPPPQSKKPPIRPPVKDVRSSASKPSRPKLPGPQAISEERPGPGPDAAPPAGLPPPPGHPKSLGPAPLGLVDSDMAPARPPPPEAPSNAGPAPLSSLDSDTAPTRPPPAGPPPAGKPKSKTATLGAPPPPPTGGSGNPNSDPTKGPPRPKKTGSRSSDLGAPPPPPGSGSRSVPVVPAAGAISGPGTEFQDPPLSPLSPMINLGTPPPPPSSQSPPPSADLSDEPLAPVASAGGHPPSAEPALGALAPAGSLEVPTRSFASKGFKRNSPNRMSVAPTFAPPAPPPFSPPAPPVDDAPGPAPAAPAAPAVPLNPDSDNDGDLEL